ncbi:MAG TPA: DUF2512 family protein [Bacillaceae bacterium]
MNHGKALGVKALLVLPVMWIVLTLLNDISFVTSTLLGIILLLLAYFTGDMMVLPRMGNIAATVGDFVLSFLVIWMGLNMAGYDDVAGEAFATALVIAAGEYFYHKWLMKEEIPQHRQDTT